MLPRQRVVCPAADDDFVIYRNEPYGQVLVLPSRCLVRPVADDDFAIYDTVTSCYFAVFFYILPALRNQIISAGGNLLLPLVLMKFDNNRFFTRARS